VGQGRIQVVLLVFLLDLYVKKLYKVFKGPQEILMR